MTQRERSLLRVLLLVVGVGGGAFLLYQFLIAPLQRHDRTIASLMDEIEAKDARVKAINRDRKRLEQWKVMSLPTDPETASLEYAKFLEPLFTRNGLQLDDYKVSLPKAPKAGPGPKPTYSGMTVSIKARGELAGFAKMMDAFQKTPLLHRVKSLTLARPEGKKDDRGLTAQLTVEALTLPGAAKRGDELLGSAQRAVKVETAARPYGDLARKDIFRGAPPPEPPVAKGPEIDPEEDRRVLEHVVLHSITHADRETQKFRNHEAFLRILYYKAPDIRLCPSAGFDRFRVWDEEGKRSLVEGKVLRIDPRDVYFRARDAVYGIHMGQTLADALRRPLGTRELEALGLAPTPAGAKGGKAEKQDGPGGGAK